MASKKQEKKEEVVSQVPAPTAGTGVVPSYGEFAGQGNEDMALLQTRPPILNLLQALSPEVQEGTEDYVKGARPGLFLNTATKVLVPSVRGVIVALLRKYVQWEKAEPGQQGKFVAAHDPEDPMVVAAVAKAAKTKERWKVYAPNGDDLVETYTICLLQLDENDQPIGPVILSASKTKIKPISEFRARISALPGSSKIPIYAHRIVLQAARVKKSEKISYFNIQIVPAGEDVVSSLLPADSPVVVLAAEMRKQALQMKVEPVSDAPTERTDAPAADNVF